MLTLQRAAYVGEAMLYDQFLPPLFETLDEVRRRAEARTSRSSASVTAGALIGTVRIKPDGEIGAARGRARPPARRARHARCSQAAIERGGTWLFTGDRSEANLRLYRQHGFVETHREPVPGHELVYLKRPGA